jgi:hypothetical protein
LFRVGHSLDDTIPLMSEEPNKTQSKDVQPVGNWEYKPSEVPAAVQSSVPTGLRPAAASSQVPAPEQPRLTWTASEYITHQKTPRWYGMAILASLFLAAIMYLLTHDLISTVALLVGGALFCVAAARKPHVLTYTIDHDGITLGSRFHPYMEFRSFSIIREGAFASIELLPLKRFMPMTNVYYAPENEDHIVDMLSEYIPYEEHAGSLVDRFFRYIRF